MAREDRSRDQEAMAAHASAEADYVAEHQRNPASADAPSKKTRRPAIKLGFAGKGMVLVGALYLIAALQNVWPVDASPDAAEAAASGASNINTSPPPPHVGAPPSLAAAPACDTSDVEITHPRFSFSDGTAMATGIVEQYCGMPMGVVLLFSGYYADGSVAFVDKIYPDDQSNLPTDTPVPFEDKVLTPAPAARYAITFASFVQW